jgi:hypothetical protein
MKPRSSPPAPAPFDVRRMILWSVILVAVVGSLGYAAFVSGPSRFGGFDVAFKVSGNPVVIPITGDAAGKTVLTATLTNRTAKPQVLNAPAPCKTFRWILSDGAERMVQSAADDCDDLLMELTLKPGETRTETFTIALDTRRLAANGRYELIMEYWGQRGLLVLKTSQ